MKLTPKAKKRRKKTLDSFGSFLGNFLIFHHRFILSFFLCGHEQEFFLLFTRAKTEERERERD